MANQIAHFLDYQQVGYANHSYISTKFSSKESLEKIRAPDCDSAVNLCSTAVWATCMTALGVAWSNLQVLHYTHEVIKVRCWI